jgi:hypothetical protein
VLPCSQALAGGTLDRADLERLLAQSASLSDNEPLSGADSDDGNHGDSCGVGRHTSTRRHVGNRNNDDDGNDDDDDDVDVNTEHRRQSNDDDDPTDHYDRDDDDDDHGGGELEFLRRSRRPQTQNARGDAAAARVIDDPLVAAAFARGADEPPAERAGLRGQVRVLHVVFRCPTPQNVQ